MTWAWRRTDEDSAVWSVTWGIDAPWAHPAWQQYVAILVDLTSDDGDPPVIHMAGASHEFILAALDPRFPPIQEQGPIVGAEWAMLQPINYGYQFIAGSNGAALARIAAVIDQIVAATLSPDTDHRNHWNRVLFPDAYALVTSRLRDMADAAGATKH